MLSKIKMVISKRTANEDPDMKLWHVELTSSRAYQILLSTIETTKIYMKTYDVYPFREVPEPDIVFTHRRRIRSHFAFLFLYGINLEVETKRRARIKK